MAPSNDQHNVIVGALMLGSNSIAAGLLPNDTILQIETPQSNGWIDIHSPTDLQYQSRLLHPGDTVKLFIRRDANSHKVITFTMADPKNLKDATNTMADPKNLKDATK
jgi:S1-C subfamily serine protease